MAYLAYNLSREIQREKLIDLFWSDRGLKQGQDSLRQALFSIRSALGDFADDILDGGRNYVKLNAEPIETNLWREDGSINERITEQFLDDLDFASAQYDDWLLMNRRSIVERQLSRAQRLLSQIDLERDSDDALSLTRTILALDPLNEPAARTAIAIHNQNDQLGQARQAFETIRERLRSEDLNVSGKTLELMKSLQSGRGSGPQKVAHLGQGTITQAYRQSAGTECPLIDVVRNQPTFNDAIEPAVFEEFFDRLIARMTEIPEIRVCSLSAHATSQGTAKYQLLVTPGNRVSGNSIAVRLSNELGAIVWSDRATFERGTTDIHIDAHVDGLVMQLISETEKDAFQNLTPEPRTAYGNYLSAKKLFLTAAPGDYMEKITKLLHKAIEIDPDFLPPYYKLIMSYNTGMFNTRPGSDHTEMRKHAFELAQRLMFVNSRAANTHISMGWCLMWRRRFASAERSFRRALELKPYEANRLNMLGNGLIYLGYLDEGERYYQLAQDRMMHDLDFQRSDYGELHYLRQDFEGALAWLENPETRNPYRTLFWRAPTYAQLGMLKDARTDLEEMIEDIRRKWRGAKPFKPEAGIQWYFDMIPLRRAIDQDILVDGLNKVGISLDATRLA